MRASRAARTLPPCMLALDDATRVLERDATTVTSRSRLLLVGLLLGPLACALGLACGEPTLEDKCEVLCDHDAACGIGHDCETWTQGCAQLTQDTGCTETLEAYYACAEPDGGCDDPCDDAYFDWLVCIVEASQ